MVNPFSTPKAYKLALDLQKNLDRYAVIDFEGEAKYSTRELFSSQGGQMFGLLVALDENNKEVVLKAFSGQFNDKFIIEGWVEPPFDVLKYKELSKEIYSEFEDKQRSKELHKQLNELYKFHTIDKDIIGLNDIFKTANIVAGSGNCSSIKLLSYAFKKGLKPISMAEFYYGSDSRDGSYKHKEFYPPCISRCKKILKALLGLDIVYKDDFIVVIEKEAKLLSVPGRGEDKLDSVTTRLKKIYPKIIEQPAVHRLDYDTSGLMVLALTKEAHRNLSIEFINRKVERRYVALLEGLIKENSGTIELAFRYDKENKPRQKYDPVLGKIGLTNWRKIRVEALKEKRGFVSRVEFEPITGRTHQLRLHSSHHKGLNHPIVGDSLYGSGDENSTLALHASRLSFIHPITKERLNFESEPNF